METCSKKLFGGKGGMANDADIPFYAARKPCIADCQIGVAQDIVGIQQLTSDALVGKLP